MYVKPEKSTMYLLLGLGIQLLNSIRAGMFHELLIWGIFMIMTWFNVNEVPLKKRILIFIMSFVGIFLLQTVKASYRQAIWYNDYSGSKVEFFFSLLVNNAININEVRSEKEETTIARYNQGWIISRIYNNIPQIMISWEGELMWMRLIPLFYLDFYFQIKRCRRTVKGRFYRDDRLSFVKRDINGIKHFR